MSDNDGFALACKHCGQRWPADQTMGVVKAHFEVEHDTEKIELDLIVVCPQCDARMAHLATVPRDGGGFEDTFTCEPCGVGRQVGRNS